MTAAAAGRGGDVAAFEDALAEEVVAPALVHRVAAAAHVARRQNHRVERLVIDHDRGGEVLGLGARRGDAGSDRLADIARLVRGERRPRRRLGARRLGFDADRLYPRQIGGGEDPALGVGRHGDAADAGVRVRAADKGDIHRARQFDVGHELAAAEQVALVLAAQQRGAEPPGVIRHHEAPFANAAAASAIAATMLV